VSSNRPEFAPWDERVSPRILSAEESARRLRTFAAIERRLATILSDFSSVIEAPHAKATLARHAKHHEWHSFLLHHALGDSDPSRDANDPTIEDADVSAFLDAVATPKDASQTIEFLTGVYRVLIPRKITAYTYFIRALGGDANDTDARWFDMVLKDEFDGIRDGELLLQSLLSSQEEVERSANRRAELESQMVKVGGLAGPGTLGGPTKEAAAR
jgi:hypothetical protein